MPLPKHVCGGQGLEDESSSDLTIEPKKVRSSIFAGGVESDPEYASNRYRFPVDADSSLSSLDDAKSYLPYPKTYASIEPGTSTAYLCSSDFREVTRASSSKSELSSICEELDCPHHDCGSHLSDSCEDQLLAFRTHAGCSFSEYQNNDVEPCTNKELEDLLYSNEVDAGNYVLSSGRCSVNQDNQEKTKKLTIYKDFEHYFSMLML